MMVPAGATRGFTLIEIAVVILLISIMLLVTVPRLPDSPLTDRDPQNQAVDYSESKGP